VDRIEEKIKQIRDVHTVQNLDGNWTSNDYMRGMANGLELALSILDDREPNYKLEAKDARPVNS
jgi:hypothetical protein